MRKQPPFFIVLKALIRNAGEIVYNQGISRIRAADCL